ncbi:MAG: NAD(P)H-dependent oxidoreductase [Bacteroidota bacterium]
MSINKNTILLQASARSHGHTRLITNYLSQQSGIPLIDLKTKDIGYFDYEFNNQEDDFIPLIEEMLHYDLFIFATPVYWYSMSARMKTFFDRLSDLLKIRKDLGRQLRGKSMLAISCSGDPELVAGYFMPFEESADYLGMHYLGGVHTWIFEEQIPEEVRKQLDQVIAQIQQSVKP